MNSNSYQQCLQKYCFHKCNLQGMLPGGINLTTSKFSMKILKDFTHILFCTKVFNQ